MEMSHDQGRVLVIFCQRSQPSDSPSNQCSSSCQSSVDTDITRHSGYCVLRCGRREVIFIMILQICVCPVAVADSRHIHRNLVDLGIWSAAQYSTVLYSTVQYSTVQQQPLVSSCWWQLQHRCPHDRAIPQCTTPLFSRWQPLTQHCALSGS